MELFFFIRWNTRKCGAAVILAVIAAAAACVVESPSGDVAADVQGGATPPPLGLAPVACDSNRDCELLTHGTAACCHDVTRTCVRGIANGGCMADTAWSYPTWCPAPGPVPAERWACDSDTDCTPYGAGCCHPSGICVRGLRYAGRCHEATQWAYDLTCAVSPPGLGEPIY